MTDSPLPDDHRDWPTDPFRLLGVDEEASPVDLRRAYTKLIRLYKPEHHPNEFQKIRQAYEWALGSRSTRDPVPEPESPRETQPPRDPSIVHPEDELHSLWLGGATPDGYARLASSHRANPREATAERLYWLARLFPTAAGEDVPRSWVAEMMRVTRFGPSSLAHFEAAMRRDPQASFDQETAHDLFATAQDDGVPPANAFAYLGVRWEGLCRLRRWDRLGHEIDKVRPRLAILDEPRWLHLLGRLLDWVEWAGRDGEPLRKELKACLREMQHLGLSHAHVFDRLDTLHETVAGCDDLWGKSPDHVDFARAVRDGWRLEWDEFRPRLARLLARIADRPRFWLGILDNDGYPPVSAMHVFRGLVNLYSAETGRFDPHPAGADARTMRQSLADVGSMSMLAATYRSNVRYSDIRPALLTFCLREAVSLESIVPLLPTSTVSWGGTRDALPAIASADPSLSVVVQACRAFRG